MSPDPTRRRLLQALGGGTVAGLTGCITAGGPPPTTSYPQPPQDGDGSTPESDGEGASDRPTTTARSKTYGFEVTNDLTVENFQTSEQVSEPEPAVVDLRVNNLDPDDETTYFERTVEIGIGESETIREAFTVTGGRAMYAISAVLQPFVQGGLSKNRHRKAGYTFSAWSETMPTRNPIPVRVGSIDRESEALYPYVDLDPFKNRA